jgi:phosphoenolpyruvate carboxykinase (GTP)
MGSIMGSEITAAAISDKIGQVRRDPFAMLPFIGYHVGDYLKHWLDMKNLTDESKLPKIFYVNWFKKDNEGHFMWPGFGDNSRVLKWIFERCDGVGKAKLTPIGYMPTEDAIDTTALHIQPETMKQLTEISSIEWLEEVKSIREYYQSIGEKLPKELVNELDQLEIRLNMSLQNDSKIYKTKS